MTICPEILRQRLIVEGIHGLPAVDEGVVREVLHSLTGHLGMTPIADTLIFSPDAVSTLHHGIGGFQAWAESGCSLYTWSKSRLFTIDIYSCKGFESAQCIEHIRELLHSMRLDWREA